MVNKEIRTCHDCRTPSRDWVLEQRTTGGGGSEFGYTYAEVPVCANRRDCKDRQNAKAPTQRGRFDFDSYSTKHPNELAYELLRRVEAYRASGKTDEAVRDITEALKEFYRRGQAEKER